MDSSQQQENIGIDQAPPASAAAPAAEQAATTPSKAAKSLGGLNASLKRPSVADHTPHRPHAPDRPLPNTLLSLSAASVLGFGANSSSSPSPQLAGAMAQPATPAAVPGRDQASPAHEAFIHKPFVSSSPPIPAAMANRKPAFSVPEFPVGHTERQETKDNRIAPASPPIPTAIANRKPTFSVPEFPPGQMGEQEANASRVAVSASAPIPKVTANPKTTISGPETTDLEAGECQQEVQVGRTVPASPPIPTAMASRKATFSVPEYPDGQKQEQDSAQDAFIHKSYISNSPPIPTATVNRKPTFSVSEFPVGHKQEEAAMAIAPVSPPIPAALPNRKPMFSVPEFRVGHKEKETAKASHTAAPASAPIPKATANPIPTVSVPGDSQVSDREHKPTAGHTVPASPPIPTAMADRKSTFAVPEYHDSHQVDQEPASDAFIHKTFVSNSPPIPTALANRKPTFSIPEFPPGHTEKLEVKVSRVAPVSPSIPAAAAKGKATTPGPTIPDSQVSEQQPTASRTVPVSPPNPTAMPNPKTTFAVPEFPEGQQEEREPARDAFIHASFTPNSPPIPTALANRKSTFSIPEFPPGHKETQGAKTGRTVPASPPIPTAIANRKPAFSIPEFPDGQKEEQESKAGPAVPLSPPIPTMTSRKPVFSVPEFPDSQMGEQSITNKADEHKVDQAQAAQPPAQTPRHHVMAAALQATPSTVTARLAATGDIPQPDLTTPTPSAQPTPAKPQTPTFTAPRAPTSTSTTKFKRTPSTSTHLLLSARKSTSRLSIQPTEQPSAVKKHSIVALTRAAAAGAFKGPGSPSAAPRTPGKTPATPAHRRVQQAAAAATPRRAMSPGPLEAVERVLREDMDEQMQVDGQGRQGHELDRLSEGSESKSGESETARIEDVLDHVGEARRHMVKRDADEYLAFDQNPQQAHELDPLQGPEPVQDIVDGAWALRAGDHEDQQEQGKMAESKTDNTETQEAETSTPTRTSPSRIASPVTITNKLTTAPAPVKSAAGPRPLAAIMSSFNALRSNPPRSLDVQAPITSKPLGSEPQALAAEPQERNSEQLESRMASYDVLLPPQEQEDSGSSALAASAEPQGTQGTPTSSVVAPAPPSRDLHLQRGADTPDTDAGTPLRSASSVFAQSSFASSPTPAGMEREQRVASTPFRLQSSSVAQAMLAAHTRDMPESPGSPPSRALHEGAQMGVIEEQFDEAMQVQEAQPDHQHDHVREPITKTVSTPAPKQQHVKWSETAMQTSPMPTAASAPLSTPPELASIAVQAQETPASPMSRVRYSERDLERAREELTQDYDAILLAEMNKRDAELEALTAECQRLEKEQNDSVAIIQEADVSLQKLESDLALAQSQLTHERHMRAAAEAEAARERRDRNDQVAALQAKYDQLETEYMRVRVNLQDVTGERDELKRKTMEDAVTITSMLADLKKSEEQAREVRDYARQRLEVANMEVAKCHQTYRLEIGGLRGQLQVALSDKQAAEASARQAATRVQELESIAEELLELVGGQVKDNERKWVEYFSAQVPLPPAGMEDGEDEDL
ncbi:hypothetical protein BCR44DRAFT_77217 [Catenaria anguillulae PL171]|uniref:Transforming acidic coiled-coil-containing protein C-terminal domain-containing protein n=1 Tax=Catenaria anguillulae PL171 TaxID=765915 RepID=A0A1Y2HYT4_9FUNG|nr:hypothetical protein BCR44DRAFT_77217 [Catenaria anguillulae PL171]